MNRTIFHVRRLGADDSARSREAAQLPLAIDFHGRLSRRQFLRGAGVGVLALIAPSWARAARLPLAAPRPDLNVVVRWNDAALQGVRDSKLGPPMVARALAIVHTCVYDAWAAYDKDALGTQLGGRLRQHPSQRHLANQNKAISFAAYRAVVDLFPVDKATLFDPF